MMILRNSAPSPFGRKINIAASVLGLADQITVQAANSMDTADTLRQQNPIGKIPALIIEDGSALFDSRVILEYLDHRAGGGKIIPSEPNARFSALRLQAICDGTLDATLLVVYEGRFRPVDRHEPKWLDHQKGKIDRGFAALEASPLAIDPTPNVGQIALACLLGYHDLRFNGDWRKSHPKLVAWLDRFAAQVPAFDATKVAA